MGVTHKSMNYAAIDFREPGFSGSVRVAVLPNDSRLPSRDPIGDRKLGDLPDAGDAGLTNWYIPFTGLQPEHYHAVAIYSSDPGYGIGRPFHRQCFLTNRHLDDCPADAYRNRDGVPRC